MKRCVTFLLTLLMMITMLPTASAAGTVTPTAPAWIDETEYVVFPGDAVYEQKNWAKIEALRATAGEVLTEENREEPADALDTPGYLYELGLVRLKQGQLSLAAGQSRKEAFGPAQDALASAAVKRRYSEESMAVYPEAYLWYIRGSLLEQGKLNDGYVIEELERSFGATGKTVHDLFASPFMEVVTAGERAAVETQLGLSRNRVELWLDGVEIQITDTKPEIKNGRTMIPIRVLAERLGADVEWVAATRKIIMKRAGVTVVMTVGKTTATINGKTVRMDVAPYITGGRTLIPARYAAEFFGQKVDWDAAGRRVLITEDKTAAGNSNLEAWAIPMGAVLSEIHYHTPVVFASERATMTQRYTISAYAPLITEAQYAREILAESWDIVNREELMATVRSMTQNGHNAEFLSSAAYIKSLSAAEYRQLVSSATGIDAYMWPYTKELSEKWGERGILCWDLFRMSNLVQWGYLAGYVTYTEALALLEPAATRLQENFRSWDEAYENYLDGYHWWSREDMRGKDVWDTTRGRSYRELKADDAALFDDALFSRDIISVPGT